MSTGIVEAFNRSTFLVQVQLLLSVAQTLAIEIRTGERYSRKVSPMLQAKDLCGTVKRTKRGVLADYVVWMNEILPRGYEPTGTVASALAK